MLWLTCDERAVVRDFLVSSLPKSRLLGFVNLFSSLAKCRVLGFLNSFSSTPQSRMLGFLNVHKPIGCTSRDVVNTIQRLLRPEKVGHAGTLDPLASGVLVVAVGGATRLIEWVQQQSKVYEGSFRFGVFSPTDDLEGELTENAGPIPTRSQIEAILPQFTGQIQQVPPVFSAIKVDGKRAFDLARKGREVELESRPVMIYSLELLDYNAPDLKLRVHCGAGTYIRSLGRDIAHALGTQAVMTSLCRTSIGGFELSTARRWEDFKVADREEVTQWLVDPFTALPKFPVVELSIADCRQLLLGKGIGQVPREMNTEARALGRSPWGPAFALLKPIDGRWRIEKAFAEMLQKLEEESPRISSQPAAASEPESSAADPAIAIREERKRLASELHDGLVQEVMGAKLLLESTLDYVLDPEFAMTNDLLKERLEKAIGWLNHAAIESRDLIRDLDGSAPTAAQSRQKLDELKERWLQEHPGIGWSWSIDFWPTGDSVAWDVYRLIQEATRNVIDHARAKSVSISLKPDSTGNFAELIIADDGVGFDAEKVDSARHGLQGIRARIARLGGTLDLQSPIGKGTTLRCTLPASR